MLENQIEQIKRNKPLVHNITNVVSIHDVANIELAIGASPIMAEAKEEVEEITTLAKSLNINLGMLTLEKYQAILLASKKAQVCHHPIVLDVVGIGASSFRKEKVAQLLSSVQVSVIKGNRSEIKNLYTSSFSRGVDVSLQDQNALLDDLIIIAKKVAIKYQCVIVMTGKEDVITDGKMTYLVKNGHEKMQEVTGTGCQLSGLLATFITNDDPILESCVGAVCTMGLAGEIAYDQLEKGQGNATYGLKIIDAINLMNSKQLVKGANYAKYQG